MTQEQTIENIALTELLDKVRSFRASKHRLAQICATDLGDKYELLYSFDLQGKLTSLRTYLPIPANHSLAPGSAGGPTTDATHPHLQSISSIYGASILYENELHDLFGIQMDGLAVDFHGNLYKTAIKYPMGSKKAPTPTCETK
ncbi:MAG: NADH-quinone oxidoreductase subunit C [Phycisphaerales bacterium]|nr:NADH-quinone oxidoreductase subunit C [Phycisphaerales bacterium]